MRRFTWLTFAALGVALLALAPLAAADNVIARSLPDGDITAISSSGSSTTNHDKDADFNTLTQADQLGLFYAVNNNADIGQTLRITVVLDGPGSVQDVTLVDQDVFFGPRDEQGSTIVQGRFEFQVKRKDWPAGTYTLSVTGAGSESVTATSTFTISY